MLSPEDRALLSDLLAPPTPDAKLEHAVAATFTLHLSHLLMAPMGLAGRGLSHAADLEGLLLHVQDTVDRLDVFCQAGQISVEAKHNDLLSFLEPAIHQVHKKTGLFHPKIWILRYSEPGAKQARLRLICGSRNLTPDTTWDAAVVLEGSEQRSKNKASAPVASFLEGLGAKTLHGLSPDRRRRMDATVAAIARTAWAPPSDSTGKPLRNAEVAFHYLDSKRPRPKIFEGHRRLIISPFLNDQGLDIAWPDRSGDATVVSRPEALDDLAAASRPSEALTINNAAALIEEGDPDEAGSDNPLRWALSGLHAKIYVVERGRAHVFIGSANATSAAWNINDEFMVEIIGTKRQLGVSSFLDAKGLGSLLVPHVWDSTDETDEDADLIWEMEEHLRTVAAQPFVNRVDNDPHLELDVSSTEQWPYKTLKDGRDIAVSVRPVTTPGTAKEATAGEKFEHSWPLEAIEDITPFLVLEATVPGSAIICQTIVLAKLVNDHDDRIDRIIAKRLGTPEAVMRFLLVILGLVAPSHLFDSGTEDGSGGGHAWTFSGNSGLLEGVTRALVTNPRSIDSIHRITSRLERTESGAMLLPPGWDEFWQPVLEARRSLGDGA